MIAAERFRHAFEVVAQPMQQIVDRIVVATTLAQIPRLFQRDETFERRPQQCAAHAVGDLQHRQRSVVRYEQGPAADVEIAPLGRDRQLAQLVALFAGLASLTESRRVR